MAYVFPNLLYTSKRKRNVKNGLRTNQSSFWRHRSEHWNRNVINLSTWAQLYWFVVPKGPMKRELYSICENNCCISSMTAMLLCKVQVIWNVQLFNIENDAVKTISTLRYSVKHFASWFNGSYWRFILNVEINTVLCYCIVTMNIL